MSKLEFMKELESLLLDIPLEEREEALKYYNSYFEDAGEEHEKEVLQELGTPVKVAKLIKADLSANAEERENRGYFTEKGYNVADDGEDKYEIIGSSKDRNTNKEQTGSADRQSTYNQDNKDSQNSGYNQGFNQNQGTNNNQGMNHNQNNYRQNSYNQSNYNQSNNQSSGYNQNQNQYNQSQSGNRNSNTGLLILIAICTSFIWGPLLLGAVGIAIGIIAAILGIIFGFGVAGVSMIVVGISLFVAGLIQISVPFIGAVMVGGGLIVLGLGMLLTLACIMICKKVLPGMIRGFVDLCRRPFKNRRVMA
jgi:uncharacterized membrane protein